MNADVLMNMYKNDPRSFKIVDGITLSKPQHFHLKGLQGSTSQFILAAVHANEAALQTNHLVIFFIFKGGWKIKYIQCACYIF